MATHLVFPGLLKATEKASAEAQRYFFLVTGGQLSLLALAAISAVIPEGKLANIGPTSTLICFILAITIQISGATSKLEKRWYAARAASESIKTAAWEFSVCGEAFRREDTSAERRFIEVLKNVLAAVPSLEVGAASSKNGSAVTNSMRDLRDSPQNVRSSIYIDKRVNDQVDWYTKKSEHNKKRYLMFGLLVVIVELIAVVLGIARVSGNIGPDFLSPLAACAAGLIGWVQAKKYANISEAYAITSHEISFIPGTLKDIGTEEEWAQAVHDAEAAFSREHTMWQARRQGPM